MSYARAIEGESNATVLDPAFHRQAQPPSVARDLRTAGIPAPPVPSINRPQIFSFPRPANPTATSDLRGQQTIQVPIARGLSGLGQTTISLMTPAQAALRAARGNTAIAQQILAGQTPRRTRGMSGLGQQVTFPLPKTLPDWLSQSIEAVKQAPILGAKLAETGILTGDEARLFNFLTPEQQKLYAQAGVSLVKPSSAGITDKISTWLSAQSIAGIPNGALAAGAGLFVLFLSGKKGRR